MKAQSTLKLVPKTLPAPYDDAKGIKAINRIRDNLMGAAVKYIVSGMDGTVRDRERTASNLSGIPLSLLAVEVAKAQKQ